MSGGRLGRRAAPPELPLREVVPERLVLTELARGFLLASSTDRSQATRFAQSFLKQQGGSPAPERLIPIARLPVVRRGIHAALRQPGSDLPSGGFIRRRTPEPDP